MTIINLIEGDWQPSNKHYEDDQKLDHQEKQRTVVERVVEGKRKLIVEEDGMVEGGRRRLG